MSDQFVAHDEYVKQLVEASRQEVFRTTGADRVHAYITWSLLKEGYYSPEELIEMSLHGNFTLDSPYARIRRGTRIGQRVIISNNSTITGQNVSVGAGTILDNAQVSGDNVILGERNYIAGPLTLGNMTLGDQNDVRSLIGDNHGTLSIGHHNTVSNVSCANSGSCHISIGDYNELHPGLQLNCIFPVGNIRIGNYNSLGRDGGGVVSNAYRYTSKWWGDVLVGSYVETTRGAEILGFSMIGWPLTLEEEAKAQRLFVDGPIEDIRALFTSVWDRPLPDQPADKAISLFGVVKVKMTCLAGRVRAKDGTRIQSSYLKDFFAWERSKLYFTVVQHSLPQPLQVSLQGRAIENARIEGDMDWARFPMEEQSDGYRPSDALFYAR